MIPYNTSEFPFTCKTDGIDPFWEISSFVVTVFYQGIGLILHLLILKIILVTEKKYYEKSSFFYIFITDSIESSILIILALFFNRLFIYVPPLCPIVAPYFFGPSIILQSLYVITNHLRFAKSLTQIAMVLNRMTCVMMPTNYDQIWKKLTPVVWITLLILPFAGTWNILISRVYIGATRGGFTMNYIKAVEWASLSMFQSIFIVSALFFTIICTTVTLYKLIMLPGRIKSVEKTLCISSIGISVTFLLVAATQLAFAFCASCSRELLYILQLYTYDTFTVGSGVIMIITDKKLRESIFPSIPKKFLSKHGAVSPSINRGRSVSLY